MAALSVHLLRIQNGGAGSADLLQELICILWSSIAPPRDMLIRPNEGKGTGVEIFSQVRCQAENGKGHLLAIGGGDKSSDGLVFGRSTVNQREPQAKCVIKRAARSQPQVRREATGV